MTATTGHKTISHALAAVQAEMPAIPKTAVNPAYKRDGKGGRYADLASIMSTVRPMLAKNGLALTYTLETILRPAGALQRGDEPREVTYEPEAVVTATLLHPETSGTMQTSVPLVVERAGMQAVGSAITYARRYAVSMLLDIVSDEEDDGNAAQAAAPPPKQRRQTRTPAGPQDKPTATQEPDAAIDPDTVKRLWVQADTRARKFGDESITKEVIVRAALDRFGLHSSKEITNRQVDAVSKAIREWEVPGGDTGPADDATDRDGESF